MSTATLQAPLQRTPIPATPDYAAIKQRQQATWASGDFAVIGVTLQIVGESLAEAADIRAGERVRSAYGPNYDRLVRVMRQYDPANLFRLNQNINPA